MKLAHRSLFAVPALLFGACSPGSSSPALSSLTYDPMQIPAQQATPITGAVSFATPDGTLAALQIQITLPNGMATAPTSSDLSSLAGQLKGTLSFTVELTAPIVGDYLLGLWVTDEAGHDSNTVSGHIQAM